MLLKKNKKVANKLLISLPSLAGQPIPWYHQSHQGDTQEGELTDETALHELLPLAATSQITVLIPTKSVLFNTVTFNGKYHRQHLPALAWQLESFCPGEVEELHLTVIQRHDTQFSIAAIDKNQLQQWLSWLQRAGLTATRALPDVLALPSPTAGWSAARFNANWLIRQSAVKGFSADEEELGFILGRYPSLPAILSYSPRPAGESTWLQKNEQPIWPLLAQGVEESNINLLHGDFTPPRQAKPQGNKLLLALTALYLLTFAIPPGLSGYSAQQQAEQIQAKTHQLFLTNFPHAAIPKQWLSGITQQINHLEKGITPPGLLTHLRAAMPVLQSLKNTRAQTMEWQGDTLSLTFNLPEAELLSRMAHHHSEELSITTYSIDQQHTRLTVTGVHNDDEN
ncbi:type II secretion system protein GspL [Yersinia bercovieri]|uniref:type II secretion system protein GspL n=1 Tax=Yersinia bercovieri TaxID=634 RepID=UPI0021BD9D20|nr:type II secretion system protein GspL [Yersinia bercovieri]